MKLFYLKTCDTCRKAVKHLASFAPTLVEIRNDGLEAEEVSLWLAAVGPDVLINKKSRTWRELSSDQRNADPTTLILENPTVMKRPVIITDDQVLVGWTAATQAALGIEPA